MLKILLTPFIITSIALAVYKDDQLRYQVHLEAKDGHFGISYKRARKVIFGDIYLERDSDGYFVKDVYCHQVIRHGVGPQQEPDHRFYNTEHSWPQSRFTNKYYNDIQKADMHHLFPANSRANSKRGNHIFADVAGDDPTPNCDCSKFGRVDRRAAFMPPSELKGDIARALFYFATRYEISIDEVEEYYLRQWHVLDPVDDFEVQRNTMVESYQGNRNPFIDSPELVHQIADF